jgi:hypothetical protein
MKSFDSPRIFDAFLDAVTCGAASLRTAGTAFPQIDGHVISRNNRNRDGLREISENQNALLVHQKNAPDRSQRWIGSEPTVSTIV